MTPHQMDELLKKHEDRLDAIREYVISLEDRIIELEAITARLYSGSSSRLRHRPEFSVTEFSG